MGSSQTGGQRRSAGCRSWRHVLQPWSRQWSCRLLLASPMRKYATSETAHTSVKALDFRRNKKLSRFVQRLQAAGLGGKDWQSPGAARGKPKQEECSGDFD
ncbi:hypothetical protein ACQJBY_039278 [Aegilops geniculata]